MSAASKLAQRLEYLSQAVRDRDWVQTEFHLGNVINGVVRVVGETWDGMSANVDDVDDEVWQRLAKTERTPLRPEQIEAIRAHGGDDALLEELAKADIYKNHLYTVTVTRHVNGWVEELSIRRNDRKAVHDWRHFQRIKDELAGEEIEAVEVYPARRRLMDTANQYYLYCLPPGVTLPLGYDGPTNLVDAGEHVADGAIQRPLPEDWESTFAQTQARIVEQRAKEGTK